MYLTPSAKRRSNQPEPSNEGYKSPWPGGHHSNSTLAGQETGFKVFASTLGTAFCINSKSRGSPNSGYSLKNSNVSRLVLKLFITRKRSCEPCCLRKYRICFAIKSRNVNSSL